MLPWGQVLWAAGGSVLRQGTRASDARPRLLPRALQWPQTLYSTSSDNEMQDENPETRIKARRVESREIGKLIDLCVSCRGASVHAQTTFQAGKLRDTCDLMVPPEPWVVCISLICTVAWCRG